MKMQMQIGVEVYDGEQREARLTPIDQKFEVPDAVGQTLMMIEGIVDGGDKQPGDGEIDLPIGTVEKVLKNPALNFAHNALKGFDGELNVFVNLKKV